MFRPGRLLILPALGLLLQACGGGGGSGSTVSVRWPEHFHVGVALRADPAVGADVAPVRFEVVLRNRLAHVNRLGPPAITGPNADEFFFAEPPPTSIPAHHEVALQLAFQPDGPGEREATLAMDVEGGDRIHVKLTGVGRDIVTTRLAGGATPGPGLSDVGLGEGAALVVWIEEGNLRGSVFGLDGGVRPVARAGATVPERIFTIAPGLAPPFGNPRVAALGAGFLVAIESAGDILAWPVGADGAVGAPRNLTSDFEDQGTPIVAATPTRTLVAWHHAGLSVEGVILDGGGATVVPRFTITTDVSGQQPRGDGTELTATCDGRRFLLVHRDARGSFSGLFVGTGGSVGSSMRLYPSRIEEPDLEIDAPAVATDGDTFLVVASLGGGHGGHGEGDGTYARLFAHGGGLMEEVHIGGAHLISTWPRKDLNTVAHDGDGYLIGLHSVTLDHAVLDLLRVHRGHGSHGGPKAEATSRLFQIILAGGSLFPLPSLVGYEGGFLMVSDVADGGNDVIDVIASSSEAARVIEWDLDFDPKVNRFSPFYVSHDPAASDPLFAGPWISYNGDGPAARNVVARVDPDSSFFREYRVAPATQRIGLHGIHAGNGRVWFTGNETDVFGYLDPLTRGVATVPLAPGSKPHVVVTDDLGHAWIALDGTNQLASFDPVSERLTLRTLPTPGAGPHGIFPRHDPVSGRREIWVTEREALKVARLLPGTMGQPDRWDEWTLFGVASTEPLFLVVDAADRAWVGLSRDDRIARLDPVSGLLGLFELPLVTPSPTVGALSGPVQVTLAPDGAGLALAEVGTGQLALFTPGTPGVEVRPAVVTTMAAAPFPSTPFVSRSLATFTEVLRPAIEARMVGVTRRGAFREWQTTLTNEPQPTGYSASAGGGPTRLAVVRGDLFYTEMRQDRVGFLKFSR